MDSYAAAKEKEREEVEEVETFDRTGKHLSHM